ncbi:hypothetical protein M3Y98_00832400 [Aphelenchoides besseyi]|nr:hypothetical protein M3Y98_00832400 [Aphelenchoides besseyi]KAI6195433.1 hypothetical protein M3Y96_01230900 [Aphelenchoides besseyi]
MSVHRSSPPKLLKVGSAPAGTGALIVNPTSWRAESPLQHLGIGFDVQRPFGVLHRIDSQPAGSFHSTLSLNPVQPLRCPSCRLHCELCCAKCATQKMGLHKLRDVNREFYLRKAEICTQIDQELQVEMRYQSDLHAKQRTIRETSAAITAKTESITRLKRQLLVLKARTSKFVKNVSTLERKSVSHAIRIQKNNQENDRLRLTLQELENKNFQYVRFLTILLDHYIPIKKFELTTEKQRSIPSTVTSVITGLVASTQPIKQMATTVKSWPPVKNYYFTINGCEARDNSEYHPLESELIAGSALVLSSRAQPAFAALTYLTQFTSSMAILLDFNLPYRFTVRDLATWSRWTGDSFASDQYRLNTNVIALCAAFGLSNDVLRLQSPFNNLFILIQELHKNNKINSISGLLNEQIKHQLVERFNKINYEEREDEFSIEQIEEDWVSVDYAVLR